MYKIIGVESTWGFGNFLYTLSLALYDIYTNNRDPMIFIVESNNCGYDHVKNKTRHIKDYLYQLFDPKLKINQILGKKSFISEHDSILYTAFNQGLDLSSCQDYIIDTLAYSSKSKELCDNFLETIQYKDNKKEYICLNIRSGDYKYYFNNIDEALDIDFFYEAIDLFPTDLPIVVNIIKKEETEDYKKKFKQYENRIYFSSDFIDYPMFLPIISKAKYCVISNSTFYWWGAFLNKDGEIYYPQPWFRVGIGPYGPTQKMWYPSKWKIIENKKI